MLKFFNLTKSRVNCVCRHISTTKTQWQGGEVVRSAPKSETITSVDKKDERLPLVKNFFLGKIDVDLMAYPEAVQETEHQKMMHARRSEYENFLESNIFAHPDDVDNIRKMREFGCFRNTSAVLTDTMFSVYEAEAKSFGYASFLNNHQQVLKLIDQHGDATLKLKYLPKLRDELIGVPCIFEANLPETGVKLFTTQATYSDATDEFTLNGAKNFILLSPAHKDVGLFLVLASMETVDHKGDFIEGVAAFLVEGSLPGVSISKVDETLGLSEKALSQVTVTFDNVTLKKSDVLAEHALKILPTMLNSMRLNKGVQALGGVMKPLMKGLINHAINTKVHGTDMKDIDIVKEQLGALTSNYYVLESMVYMTAGLIDIYDKQDVEVECAMVHAFAVQAMTNFIVRPMHAVGPEAVVKGKEFEKYIREAAQVAASGDSMDSVNQTIALTGLHYAGHFLNENVVKNRNPLNNPGFIFHRFFDNVSIEHPKKKFDLEGYLHPSLFATASRIEKSVIRLGAAVDILLGRHGPLVIQHTVETALIAEAATLCYAMFATASRASRSYCIGLRNADQEIQLANCYCFYASKRVKEIAMGIDNSEFGTSEHTFKALGKHLIESKDYHLEHPTTRNF